MCQQRRLTRILKDPLRRPSKASKVDSKEFSMVTKLNYYVYPLVSDGVRLKIKFFVFFSILLGFLVPPTPSHPNKRVKIRPGTYFHLLNHPQGLDLRFGHPYIWALLLNLGSTFPALLLKIWAVVSPVFWLLLFIIL